MRKGCPTEQPFLFKYDFYHYIYFEIIYIFDLAGLILSLNQIKQSTSWQRSFYHKIKKTDMKNNKINTLSLPATAVALSVSIFILIGGCNSNDKKSDAVADTETVAANEVLPESSLQLDNGSKWKANPETTEGINNMIAVMKSFQEGENASDYLFLKEALEKEFKLIFQRCTMTGEAHDQLHNYLMPLKDLISRLDNTDAAVIGTTITDIDDHLQLYFEFFE